RPHRALDRLDRRRLLRVERAPDRGSDQGRRELSVWRKHVHAALKRVRSFCFTVMPTPDRDGTRGDPAAQRRCQGRPGGTFGAAITLGTTTTCRITIDRRILMGRY